MMDEHEGRGLTEFLDDRLEYRRLFSEVWGTFLLVLVAAGAGAVGAQPYGGGLILPVKVIAPGVMVMAIIYFMGARPLQHPFRANAFGDPIGVCTKASPVYQTQDFGYLAWHLGPEGGDPVAGGFDVVIVRNDVVAELYTVITK